MSGHGCKGNTNRAKYKIKALLFLFPRCSLPSSDSSEVPLFSDIAKILCKNLADCQIIPIFAAQSFKQLIMAEETKKQPDEELQEEQLDEVSGGHNKRFDGGFF